MKNDKKIFAKDTMDFSLRVAEENKASFLEFCRTKLPSGDGLDAMMSAAASTMILATIDTIEGALKKEFPDSKYRIDLSRDVAYLKRQVLQKDLFPQEVPKDKIDVFSSEAVSKISELYKAILVGFLRCVGEKGTEATGGPHVLRLNPEEARDFASFILSLMDHLVDLSAENIANVLGEDYHQTRANLLAQISDYCDCEECEALEKKPTIHSNGTVH